MLKLDQVCLSNIVAQGREGGQAEAENPHKPLPKRRGPAECSPGKSHCRHSGVVHMVFPGRPCCPLLVFALLE